MSCMSKSAAAEPTAGPLPRPLTVDRRTVGGIGARFPAIALGCLLAGALGSTAAAAGDRPQRRPQAASTSRASPAALASAPAPRSNRDILIDRADQAFHAKRYAEAADLYRRAAALDPRAGDAPLMAAVAAFQLEEYGRARRDLTRAMSRQLSPEDRALGLTYLELLEDFADKPSAAGDEPFTATVSTSLGGTFDTNPHHQGAAELQSETSAGLRRGTGIGSAALELALTGRPLPRLELELGYTLEQAAYSDRSLADLDYQDHQLELALAGALGDSARLRLTLAGEMSLSGLGAGLTPFSRGLRADADVVLGTGSLQLRLGAGYQATELLDPSLAFLTGYRFEVRATPTIDLGGWRASLSARLRTDTLGRALDQAGIDLEETTCETCTVSTLTPYSNRSAALAVRLTAPWRWRLRPGLWARTDRRLYEQAMVSSSSTGGGDPGPPAPLGQRVTGGAAFGANLRLRLGQQASLTARWDYTHFAATFRPASAEACAGHDRCGQGALANRSYNKQAVGLQLEIEWL